MQQPSVLHRAGTAYRIGLALIALAVGISAYMAIPAPRSAAAACRAAGPLARLAELPEASGLAFSRRLPGHAWTHNDSGQPVLFMLDASGSVTGRLHLTGATVDDWEAVGVGSCSSGSCIYVGDIGDNNATRKRITVYRAPEPASATDATEAVDAFHATYPDGPQDAETLLVLPDGRLYIVTKGSTGPVAIYAFPRELRAGNAPVQLERVGQPRSPGTVNRNEQITDGAVSSDGSRIVLRTHHSLLFYRAAQFLAGNWREERVVDLSQVPETQGEGVAFGSGNALYVAGEGGGGSRPGTFARLECAPDAGAQLDR